MRHLCSYTCPISPVTWTSTLVGMSTQPADLFCLCCFRQAVGRLWSLHVSWIQRHVDLPSSSNVYPTSSFILSVLFLTVGETSVVTTHFWDPCHRDLHSSSKVYPTNWSILSVLFLTGSEMSMVPTHVQHPHHTDLHPSRNFFLASWFILSVLFLTGSETSVVSTHVQDSLLHALPPW